MRCILEDVTTRDTVNVEFPTPYLQQIENEIKEKHGLSSTYSVMKEDVLCIALDRILGACFERGLVKPVGVRP